MCYSRKLLCHLVFYLTAAPLKWLTLIYLLLAFSDFEWLTLIYLLPTFLALHSYFHITRLFLLAFHKIKSLYHLALRYVYPTFYLVLFAHVGLVTFYSIHNFIFNQFNKMDLILKKLNYFRVEILIKNLKNPLKMLS